MGRAAAGCCGNIATPPVIFLIVRGGSIMILGAPTEGKYGSNQFVQQTGRCVWKPSHSTAPGSPAHRHDDVRTQGRPPRWPLAPARRRGSRATFRPLDQAVVIKRSFVRSPPGSAIRSPNAVTLALRREMPNIIDSNRGSITAASCNLPGTRAFVWRRVFSRTLCACGSRPIFPFAFPSALSWRSRSLSISS